MTHTKKISTQLNLPPAQVEATIRLLDEGNTVPFISRYRKEMTGSLDDEQVRFVADEILRLRALAKRRATILKSIKEQGKLDTKLSTALNAADSLTALDDLYAPFRPKRRTRAMMAREKGLSLLADLILKQPPDISPQKTAKKFLNDDVENIEDALQGARDIIAEKISDNATIRRATRQKALEFSTLYAEKIKKAVDEKGVYESYYNFRARVDRLEAHQVLAISRGEKAKILRVRVDIAERDWFPVVNREFPQNRRSPFCEHLAEAQQDSASRLLLPAIVRDIRRALSEKADSHAIQVFATNLRALLGQAPLLGQVVLGIDPGFRSGSKIAVVDEQGKVLETGTIYPHAPQVETRASRSFIQKMIEKHQVTLIAIGNGTASRETEQLVAEITRNSASTKYLIVNEAGASVYSASALGRAEFPALDVSIRGAVSIARRAQDPLAELVKIDPKSLGVGMYQHDVNQKALAHALDGVVEAVVNGVGVNLNTASAALLAHIAGVGEKLAERIVIYRENNGVFKTRKELLDVAGLGKKSYEQSVGFMRIIGGAKALDASAIHPESYPIAEEVLARARISLDSALDTRSVALDSLTDKTPPETLARALNCGVPTLNDILEQLIRPGRDPRASAPAPILRADVLKIDDLVEGMRLKGTVRNVVDFGAFVDIGVKQDALLHISKIPRGTRLKVGDILEVEILKIEVERGRVSLG